MRETYLVVSKDDETGSISVPFVVSGIAAILDGSAIISEDEVREVAIESEISVPRRISLSLEDADFPACVIIRFAYWSTFWREVFVFRANLSIFATRLSYSSISRSSITNNDARGIIVCQCSFWVASSSIPTEDPGVVLPNKLIPSNGRGGDVRVCCCGGSEQGVNDSSRF